MNLNKNIKIALITGITGQDGAYLAEFLIKKGYIVHGLKRRSSLFNTDRIDHLFEDPHKSDPKLILHFGDMTDSTNLTRLIKEVQPNEIYNLAAMSHVKVSFDIPEYVADADGIGTLRLLEAIRLLGFEKTTRIYQASTSELYGKVQEVPQTETTPFYPRSPYAVAKMSQYICRQAGSIATSSNSNSCMRGVGSSLELVGWSRPMVCTEHSHKRHHGGQACGYASVCARGGSDCDVAAREANGCSLQSHEGLRDMGGSCRCAPLALSPLPLIFS